MRTALFMTWALLFVTPAFEAAAVPGWDRCGLPATAAACWGEWSGWRPVGHEMRRENRDQDRARDAYRSGDVLPLSRILSGVRRQYPGKLLDATLAPQGRGYVYVIKLLGADNRVRLIYVDAQTGGVLSVR